MYRSRLNEKVFTALGAASACWDDLEGAGVFQSEKCKLIGEALIADIDQMYHEWHQEWLRNQELKREAEAAYADAETAYAEASPDEPDSDDAAHWSPELLDDSDVEISPGMVQRMAALDRAKDLLKGMTRTGIGTGAVGPGPKELITLAEWILNGGADDGQPGSVD